MVLTPFTPVDPTFREVTNTMNTTIITNFKEISPYLSHTFYETSFGIFPNFFQFFQLHFSLVSSFAWECKFKVKLVALKHWFYSWQIMMVVHWLINNKLFLTHYFHLLDILYIASIIIMIINALYFLHMKELTECNYEITNGYVIYFTITKNMIHPWSKQLVHA